MEGPGPWANDPAQLRISDADRHQVAEFLREAAGEGRLDLDELDERLGATYGAKVYADLVPIVADLPGQLPAPVQQGGVPVVGQAPGPLMPGPVVPGPAGGFLPRHDASLAILSGQDRKGPWEIGPTHNAFTLMGGITLDLRQARFSSMEIVINANAVMGGIDVVVNQWTRVSIEGHGIMGGFEMARDKVAPEIGPGSPLVRVRGIALMAGVTVTRKRMPGEPRPKRLRKS
ncbi:DUF1707 SHOCT-like domain-containing protein [Nocardioides pacificus]